MRLSSLLAFLAAFFLAACGEEPSSSSDRTAASTEPAEEATPQPLDRFEAEIQAFEAADQSNGIDTSRILFIGSSSIRLWNSLAEDLAPMKVLNRGFGGSTLPEVSYYANRIIFPYRPDTIFLYCGENDIAAGAKPQKVYESFTALMARIRLKLPKTQIFYISMKPSIARWEMWPAFREGEELIERYIDQYNHLHYLDCSAAMLLPSGGVDSTIFVEDGLHMNAEGYRRWREMVRRIL